MPRKGGRGRGGKGAPNTGGRGKAQNQAKAKPAAPVTQELPSKEQGVFKSVLRYYEQKQFKRGIRMADAILKKFPNHGETLAMKGLILNSQEKKVEAYNYVKQGLTNNLQSHVCWHVYGLLYRSDHNYAESIKCYQQALRIDKSNAQILRDLSLLQIQTRSYDGFKETRRQMLTNKPGNHANWIAFALAAHMASDLSLALSVMNEFQKFLDEERQREKDKRKLLKAKKESGPSKPAQTKDKLKLRLEQKLKEQQKHKEEDGPSHSVEAELENLDEELFGELDFDYSEMILYRNIVIEESGDLEKALADLNTIEPFVMDRYCLQEKRGQFLLKLGRLKEAETQFRYLLSCNGENYDYHRGFQQAAGFLPAEELADATTAREMSSMGDSQQKTIKVAGTCTTNTTTNATPSVAFFCHVSYETLSQDQIDQLDKIYQEMGVTYIRYPDAMRRIPLEFLRGERFKEAFLDYVKPKLKKGVPSLFNSVRSLYRNPLKSRLIEELLLKTLESLEKSRKFLSSEEEDGDPSCVLWLLYYLANHFNALGDSLKAMEFIDRAISHTPTIVDLYVCKGRIYKHGGDPVNAAYWGNYGRELDLADRYLNVKCTKLLLRADMPEKAETVAVLFTKDGDTTLHDMQAMWYELECADSFCRLGQNNMALKNYVSVIKHFEEIDEDQMDFHFYALRKMTARAYLSMIRMENSLRSHQNYLRATVEVVKIYLDRHDNPPQTQSEEDELTKMTPEEKKKYLKKKRRQEAKAEAAAAAVAAAAAAKAKKAGKKEDEDPQGLKLLNVENPLQEALKRYRVVEDYCRDRVAIHTIGFEVYFRMRKVLLMLRCIKRTMEVEKKSPDILRMIVRLFHLIESEKEKLNLSEIVTRVLQLEREEILGGASLREFVDKYVGSATTLEEILAGAEMRIHLSSTEEEKKKGFELLKEHVVNPLFLSLSTHISVSEFVKKEIGEEEGQEIFQICSKKFPFSRFFHNEIPEPSLELGKHTFSSQSEEEAEEVPSEK